MKDSAGGNVVPLFRDGLISLVSGMGTSTDPRSYQRYHSRVMSDHEIDQAYRGSWVIRKAIDKPATEMVREWRDWQAESDDIAKLEAEEKRLDLRNKVKRAEILRGLGGAGMVLWVRGQDPMQPLNPATIEVGALKTIHVWHRSRFTLGEMIGAWDSPWFGQPSYFEVQLQGAQGGTPMRFHPSRVVAFKAEHVGDIVGASWMDWFWGQSKVQTIMDAAQNVDMAENGFAALIKDARNRRISIPGLLNMVSTAAGEAQLAKRLQAFALGESSNSVSWLDGGAVDSSGKLVNAEKIEDRQMVWAGMPDIMNAYRTAMAAAADMPVTVLWGTSPAGLNATGQSDLDLYDKMISGRQDLDLRPCMTQIDAALIPSALGKQDDTIWYSWAPLSTQSEKDEATTYWNTMQGLQILAGLNLIPDIALSKATQTLLSERGWMPGLDDALAEIPETERFPELEQPGAEPEDPNAITQSSTIGKEADPNLAGRAGGSPVARRRAANDAAIENMRSLMDAAEASDMDRSVVAGMRSIMDAAIARREAEGEQGRPFGDAYNAEQPRDEHGRWASTGSFATHVKRARASSNERSRTELGGVTKANADHVREQTGTNISGHTRIAESSDIRHVFNSHGDPATEAARKKPQIAVTHTAMREIPNIIENAHTINLIGAPNSLKHPRLEYIATISGHEHHYIEEIRSGKTIVALKSMKIMK